MNANSNGVITEQLINFLRDTCFEDLPAQVVHDTKRLIADTICCAIGARNFEAGRIAAEVAADLGTSVSGGAATVFGFDAKASPAAAASANMYLGNFLDADDTFLNFSHPAVAAVFPALAFAEAQHLSGRDLITAVALGFEVGARAGIAMDFIRQSPSGETKMVSGTFSWYSFCIVGALGKLLGFDAAQYNNAFGLAGWTVPVQTGQYFAPILRPGKHMLKYSPVGFYGMSGVMAVQLAQKGFVGEQNIFDAGDEFWVTLGALGLNRERLLDELGTRWQIGRTSIKPYASGRYSQHAVTLFNQLVREHDLQVEEIDSVVVRTFERGVNWLGPKYPMQTAPDMQFSIPRAIAAAAYGSDLGPKWQYPEQIRDPQQIAFTDKVVVVGYPGSAEVIFEQMLRQGYFTHIPNEVSIKARGQEFKAGCECSWGDPWTEETRMTDAELGNKFRTFANEALSSAQADTAYTALLNLEQAGDIASDLIPLLRS